jgi:hypothetical protein
VGIGADQDAPCRLETVEGPVATRLRA